MITVRFIRHAESAANAGAATTDPASIPLTPGGHEQAKTVSLTFAAAPDLIICSPFLRVRQTAAPTLARFASTPTATWPIEEFTYLAPGRCADTTGERRKPWVARYWAASDPLAVDGSGAESFASFMARVSGALDRLAQLPLASVALLGHGQFMQAVRWKIVERPLVIGAGAMRAFRNFDLAHPIANGAQLIAVHDGMDWVLV